MKILLIILIFLATEIPTPQKKNGDNNLTGDSIKKEIKCFENKLFNLPIDSVIDSTGFYVSVYKFEDVTKTISGDRKKKRKKYQAYLKWEEDSILIGDLKINDSNLIIRDGLIVSSDHLIVSKDYFFENLKEHEIGNDIQNRYIIGFDKRYLIIRSVSFISYSDSKHNGPSYLIEEYLYYERKN